MGEYAPVVVARRRIRPATAALYAKLLRLTILPTWADRALDDITAAEIATWYAGMQNTPTQQYWARNPLNVLPEDAFPLVGRRLVMVGLTGLELVNRLRRRRWTVGDCPRQSGIH